MKDLITKIGLTVIGIIALGLFAFCILCAIKVYYDNVKPIIAHESTLNESGESNAIN